MPFAQGAHPEYEAFYNGLSGIDKEAFKRFRRSHPTLTNQEAMSMSNSTTATPSTWACPTVSNRRYPRRGITIFKGYANY